MEAKPHQTGGLAHGSILVQRSLLPSHQALELPQCASLAPAQEALPAPVLVDCQDCLVSERVRANSVESCSNGRSEDGSSQV